MKKKLLLLLLISIGLLTIVSCGKKEEESFEIKYEGINITPGETLDISKFKNTYDKSEVPDCALGGKGIMYAFDDLEISTNDKNLIYSVYFLNPNYKTAEGIALGDSKDAVIKAYGDKASKSDNGDLLYQKGKVEISFIFDNDKVTSIEYTLIVE